VVGETGALEGCRVSGGRLHIRGRFLTPGELGLRAPMELQVGRSGVVSTDLEQPEHLTRFGFESGCCLRLYIKTRTTPSQRE
jgi:hypothetical protein